MFHPLPHLIFHPKTPLRSQKRNAFATKFKVAVALSSNDNRSEAELDAHLARICSIMEQTSWSLLNPRPPSAVYLCPTEFWLHSPVGPPSACRKRLPRLRLTSRRFGNTLRLARSTSA